MAVRTDKLQKSVDNLRGLTTGSDLRPVFDVHTIDGKRLGLENLAGILVPIEETGPRDVIFKMTLPVLEALRSGTRFIILEGGRGGGKSYSIGCYLLALAIVNQEKILCTRETQTSLSESVKSVLEEIIRADPALDDFFTIQRDNITGRNGSSFHFRGLLQHQVDNVRSFQGATIAWIEEGQMIGRNSLDTLIPTIRGRDDAQIFMSMNRRYESDPVFREFVREGHPQATIHRVNYTENPWCPQVTIDDAQVMKDRSPDNFDHVYAGEIKVLSELRIFHNWIVHEFDLEEIIARRMSMMKIGFQGDVHERAERRRRAMNSIRSDHFIGLDPGFIDPTALTLSFIDPAIRELYIIDERYQAGLNAQGIAGMTRDFLEIWNLGNWPVTIDSARPEIRDELNRHFGLQVVSCKKTRVTDGIDALNNWRIFIHPRCENTAREFALYSWRQDHNGNVLPIPEDEHNHCIDSIRYALGDALNMGATYERLGNLYL